MKYQKLTIVASASLLLTFQKINNSDEAMRHLLRSSVDELEKPWFDSNLKLILEAQKEKLWPSGLDCVNWPDLKMLAKDSYTDYPVDVIPASPDYVFICCAIDGTTVPSKENMMFYTMYPDCMTGEEIDWQPLPFTTLPVLDGMHRTTT